MRKKWIVILLAGLMILLTACGSGGSGSGGNEPGTASLSGEGLQIVLEQICSYVTENMTELEADSDGSAWSVYSLKVSGTDVEDS